MTAANSGCCLAGGAKQSMSTRPLRFVRGFEKKPEPKSSWSACSWTSLRIQTIPHTAATERSYVVCNARGFAEAVRRDEGFFQPLLVAVNRPAG